MKRRKQARVTRGLSKGKVPSLKVLKKNRISKCRSRRLLPTAVRIAWCAAPLVPLYSERGRLLLIQEDLQLSAPLVPSEEDATRAEAALIAGLPDLSAALRSGDAAAQRDALNAVFDALYAHDRDVTPTSEHDYFGAVVAILRGGFFAAASSLLEGKARRSCVGDGVLEAALRVVEHAFWLAAESEHLAHLVFSVFEALISVAGNASLPEPCRVDAASALEHASRFEEPASFEAAVAAQRHESFRAFVALLTDAPPAVSRAALQACAPLLESAHRLEDGVSVAWAAAGVAHALLSLCVPTTAEAALEAALWAIDELLTHASGRQAACAARGVPRLLALAACADASGPSRERACCVAARCLDHDDSSATADGVLNQLVSISFDSSTPEPVLCHALDAIHSVLCNKQDEDAGDALIGLGCDVSAVGLLRKALAAEQPQNERIVCSLSSIILELGRHDAASRRRVIEAGVLPLFDVLLCAHATAGALSPDRLTCAETAAAFLIDAWIGSVLDPQREYDFRFRLNLILSQPSAVAGMMLLLPLLAEHRPDEALPGLYDMSILSGLGRSSLALDVGSWLSSPDFALVTVVTQTAPELAGFVADVVEACATPDLLALFAESQLGGGAPAGAVPAAAALACLAAGDARFLRPLAAGGALDTLLHRCYAPAGAVGWHNTAVRWALAAASRACAFDATGEDVTGGESAREDTAGAAKRPRLAAPAAAAAMPTHDDVGVKRWDSTKFRVVVASPCRGAPERVKPCHACGLLLEAASPVLAAALASYTGGGSGVRLALSADAPMRKHHELFTLFVEFVYTRRIRDEALPDADVLPLWTAAHFLQCGPLMEWLLEHRLRCLMRHDVSVASAALVTSMDRPCGELQRAAGAAVLEALGRQIRFVRPGAAAPTAATFGVDTSAQLALCRAFRSAKARAAGDFDVGWLCGLLVGVLRTRQLEVAPPDGAAAEQQ